MRILVVALAMSCSLEPSSTTTDEVLPTIAPGPSARVTIASKFAQADKVSRVGDSQVALGALNLLLTRGTMRPTFCDTMTFERDAVGAPILPGTDLSAAYVDAGILISPAVAFDSSDPNAGALGTPNQSFGGPGIGLGGADNDRVLGNLLVKPQDATDGGWIVFDFLADKCVARADLINVDRAQPARFEFYGANEQLIDTIEGGGLGENSVEQIFLDTCGVRQLKVGLQGSGALHYVVVCNAPEPATDVNFAIDLNNIIALDFELNVYLENGDRLVAVSGGRMNLDPARAISGGNLPPLSIASAAPVPAGTYDRVRIEMKDVKAIAHDGSRVPLPGSIMKALEHPFVVRACGDTTLIAEWTIETRVEGDAFGLGLGVDFERPADRHDGCRP